MPDDATTTTTATTTGTPWFAGLDDETRGYITNRGLDKLDATQAAHEAIKAARNAQAKLGIPADQVLRVPSDANDKDGWGKVYERLGRPADPKDYQLEMLEKDKPAFYDAIRPKLHELGVTKTQGEELVKHINSWMKTAVEENTAAQTAALAVDQADLKKSWGANHAVNQMIAQKAMQKLGFSDAEVKAMETVAGYKGIMEKMLKIGVGLGEDRFVSNDLPGGKGLMTREGALERLNQKKADRAWAAKYLAGDADAVKEANDLHRLAFGDAA